MGRQRWWALRWRGPACCAPARLLAYLLGSLHRRTQGFSWGRPDAGRFRVEAPGACFLAAGTGEDGRACRACLPDAVDSAATVL